MLVGTPESVKRGFPSPLYLSSSTNLWSNRKRVPFSEKSTNYKMRALLQLQLGLQVTRSELIESDLGIQSFNEHQQNCGDIIRGIMSHEQQWFKREPSSWYSCRYRDKNSCTINISQTNNTNYKMQTRYVDIVNRNMYNVSWVIKEGCWLLNNL